MKHDDDVSRPALSLQFGVGPTERISLIDWVSALLGVLMIPAAIEAWVPDSRTMSIPEFLLVLVNGTIHIVGTMVLSATFIAMFVDWLRRSSRLDNDADD